MCKYIIMEDFLWTSIFMTKATVCGMNCREIIISLALLCQPKKNISLSAYGDTGTNERYLQEHKRAIYTTLLTSGKLNCYLADIDEQAIEMMFRLIEQMADKEGVTEQLKAGNSMLWVGRMNEIRAGAREIVNMKIIYT